MAGGSLDRLRSLNRETVTILGTDIEIVIGVVTALDLLEAGAFPTLPEEDEERSTFLRTEEGQKAQLAMTKTWLRAGVKSPRCSVVDDPKDCPPGEWHWTVLKDDQRLDLVSKIADLAERSGALQLKRFQEAADGEPGQPGEALREVAQ